MRRVNFWKEFVDSSSFTIERIEIARTLLEHGADPFCQRETLATVRIYSSNISYKQRRCIIRVYGDAFTHIFVMQSCVFVDITRTSCNTDIGHIEQRSCTLASVLFASETADIALAIHLHTTDAPDFEFHRPSDRRRFDLF